MVVSGASATLSCATTLNTDRLCWDRYAREENNWITLCNNRGCRSRYSVHTSVDTGFREHSLTVDLCNATDSGRYRCGECGSRRGKQTARLVVIGELFTLLFKCNVPNVHLAYSCFISLCSLLGYGNSHPSS